MHREKNPKELYNQRASFYDRVMGVVRNEATHTNLLRALPTTLPAGTRVLDIGCGTGLVTQLLAAHYPQVHVTGLDNAENMLSIHQQLYPSAPLILGDFNQGVNFKSWPQREPVQLLPNSFDLIISAGALSEYGQPAIAIPWCYRLLKPNGTLINIGVHKNILGEIIGQLWKFKPLSAGALVQDLQAAGFRHAEVVPATWRVFPKNLTDYTVKAEK